jgi:hypothetical protein
VRRRRYELLITPGGPLGGQLADVIVERAREPAPEATSLVVSALRPTQAPLDPIVGVFIEDVAELASVVRLRELAFGLLDAGLRLVEREEIEVAMSG